MQLIDGKAGTLKYIAESPAERHGGFAPQTVVAAKWALAEIERLKAAFGPTIELLEDWVKYMKPYTGFMHSVNRTTAEIARLRAIVEGGK